MNRPLSATQVFTEGLKISWNNIGYLLLVIGANTVLNIIPSMIQGILSMMLGKGMVNAAVSTVVALFSSIWWQPILILGLNYFLLQLVDGKKLEISHMFDRKTDWGKYWKTTLIVMLLTLAVPVVAALLGGVSGLVMGFKSPGFLATAVILGLVALSVSLYLSLRFSFTIFVIIDKGLSGQEAVKQSWQLTKGKIGFLAVLGLLYFLLNLIGLLLLGVGLLFTIPAAAFITALAYRKFTTTS